MVYLCPMRILLIVTFISFITWSNAQILLDEDYSDWAGLPSISDPSNDGSSTSEDFLSYQITNDDDYIYFKIEVKDEILIQSNNRMELLIDLDANAATGSAALGLGYELSFEFGDKSGTVRDGNFEFNISHDDIGLVTLPSLSSNIFEVAIARRFTSPLGNEIFIDGNITALVRDARSNGDFVPDNASDRAYTLVNGMASPSPDFSWEEQGEFRFVVYNSLFDGFFKMPQSAAQRKMMEALKSDIYAFVEIYDNSSAQIANVIRSMFPQDTWYHAQQGNDTHIISKYSIKNQRSIDGNGAYLLDMDGQDLLIIVAHLPASDNDISRQREADNIMAFIRNVKEDGNPFSIAEDTPIMITGDMNLYGDAFQRATLLTGDIKFNNSFGEDFAPDWDGSPLTAALPFATGTNQAITWSNDNSEFNPGRLDYIIYSDHVLRLDNTFALETASLTDAQLSAFGLNRSDTRVGSDHYPIVGDFTLAETNSTSVLWEELEIELAPNPAIDQIHLQGKLNGDIQLYDLNGKMLLSQALRNETETLDVSGLQAGMYWIEYITKDGQRATKSIVIQ